MRYSLISVLALAATSSAAVVDIDVGESGLVFNPSSTTANVGDTLVFHFYDGSGPHSVVSSTFDSPCQPASNAFFSGYEIGTTSGNVTFTVPVTSTDPIWFYCSASRHCENGMVGVVNPPSGQTKAEYAAAAASVASAAAPSSATGGVLASGTATSGASTSTGSTGSSVSSTSVSSVGSSTTSGVNSAASSAATSASTAASSVVSSASSAAASATKTGAAMPNSDAKVGGLMAAVAGGLAALLV